MIHKKISALASFRLASIVVGMSDVAIFIYLGDDHFQAFYYSALAIIGLQVLFELGTVTVIQTWSSFTHSGQHLDITHRSVSQFTFTFAFLSSMLFFIFATPYLSFLINPFTDAMWLSKIFTILYSLCCSLHFFNLFFFAYRVGTDDLSRVYFHRTVALVMSKSLYIFVLLLTESYEAILIIPLVQAIYGLSFNYRIISETINFRFNNFSKLFMKFWGLQKKLMLSWIGGFMLFNSVIPAMHFAGASNFVGQYGLTFAALQGILSISTVFMSTQLPTISFNYKAKNIKENKNIFLISVISYTFLFVSAATILFILAKLYEMDTFLTPQLFMLLSVIVFFNGFGVLINEFIRAHGDDFTHIATFLAGLLMMINCIVFVYHGSLWIFLLSYSVLFFGLTLYSSIAVQTCLRLYRL